MTYTLNRTTLRVVADHTVDNRPSAALDRLITLLREAREKRGWTQQKLADVVGVSEHTVQRFEKSPEDVSCALVLRLLNLYEINDQALIEAIYGRRAGRPKKKQAKDKAA